MGLDWMLQDDKAKDGCETEYARIKKKLKALDDDDKLTETQQAAIRKDLRLALEQVAVSAYEVIRAPRVGFDPLATEWFRTQVYEPATNHVAAERRKSSPNLALIAHWGRPFAEILKEQTGKWVAELATNPAGLASISGIMCSSLDFRGKAVALSTVIAEDLRNEAYDDHDPAACLEYADRLEAALNDYKTEHADWETRKEKDEYGGEVVAKDDVDDIGAAVKWLRFWGGNGFGYSGWY